MENAQKNSSNTSPEMRGINILIVDDEAPAREVIKHYLKSYANVSIVGEADNGFDAMKLIKELNPQLVFLDVQMPKLTGFELVDLMDTVPDIIFSTAYDQYAIRAFELNAVDYLLKPYSKERFDAAMQKAVQRISTGAVNESDLQALKQTADGQLTGDLARIAVKDRQQIHVIPVDEIHFIEADGDYVKIYTAKGAYLKEKTMKYFEANLPRRQFTRIHRSCIVNVNEVARIELFEKETYRVHLKSGEMLKASSAGYKALKEAVVL